MEGDINLNPALIEAGFNYTLGAISAVAFFGLLVAGFLLIGILLGELLYGVSSWIERRRERRREQAFADAADKETD